MNKNFETKSVFCDTTIYPVITKENRKLINQFDYIFIEDLNMDAMGKALRLGKSVHDIGWGMFATFLTYKALARKLER